MTTLAAPAGLSKTPVAWTKMAWVTWRQHRGAVAGVLVLLSGLSLLLLINGLLMRASMRDLGLTACHPLTRCPQQLTVFQTEYAGWSQNLPRFLDFTPVLIGAFTGGPLLARELESGAFRFAWTQGAGRTRPVIAKLVVVAGSVTAAAGAFSILFSWWYRPLFAAGSNLLEPRVFDLTGADFAAWTLLAFAIGACGGALIRRAVPAIAATIACWTGVALATAFYLRQHYQAALVTHTPIQLPARSYVVGTWWTAPSGQRLSMNAFARRMPQMAGQAGISKQMPFQRGYQLWFAYQPAGRFWEFQVIEGAWLLAASLLLGAATVWWVRHRTA